MSAVKINIIDLRNGFKEVNIDGRYVGRLEDPEDNLKYFFERFVKQLQLDNIEVDEK